jgi:hypothetical protein
VEKSEPQHSWQAPPQQISPGAAQSSVPSPSLADPQLFPAHTAWRQIPGSAHGEASAPQHWWQAPPQQSSPGAAQSSVPSASLAEPQFPPEPAPLQVEWRHMPGSVQSPGRQHAKQPFVQQLGVPPPQFAWLHMPVAPHVSVVHTSPSPHVGRGGVLSHDAESCHVHDGSQTWCWLPQSLQSISCVASGAHAPSPPHAPQDGH